MAAIFGHIFAHKKFSKSLIIFVERHTRKVQAKFQVPSMYGVRMNVPFSNRDLKFTSL